jgi:hypothetical protein
VGWKLLSLSLLGIASFTLLKADPFPSALVFPQHVCLNKSTRSLGGYLFIVPWRLVERTDSPGQLSLTRPTGPASTKVACAQKNALGCRNKL